MYVRDREDESMTKIGQKDGETVTEKRWEVQHAWDKHASVTVHRQCQLVKL